MGSGSVGAQQGVGQATANQQYCRLRRCVVAELGIFAAEDALRQLIVSRETRTSIDSGFKVYNDDRAWPMPQAFPVPLLLHKRVEVLEQKFRYRAFIYNGELTALTQVDELAAHEERNNEGTFSSHGNCFAVDTGVFTGRSPSDKYVWGRAGTRRPVVSPCRRVAVATCRPLPASLC